MAQEPGPAGATRPREMLASLRPQVYATGSPHKVVDPIVEPLWVGVRTLAAVDDQGALMIDADGEPIPDVEHIVEGLTAGARADALVLDGFVTKQGGAAGSVYLWSDDLPSMSTLFGLRRDRAGDTVKLKEGALDAVTFEPEDEVRLIVTDLLWLDDTSLLDDPAPRAAPAARERPGRIGLRPPRSLRPSAHPYLGRLLEGAGIRRADVQGGQQPLPAGRIEPRVGRQRDASPLRMVR